MKKKNIVACFGLGADQVKYVKYLSDKFKIIGFDENNRAPGIKYVKKCYQTPFSKKNKIKEILKKANIKKIFSFATEAPMLLIGYLNTELHLEGIKLNLIKKISNKLEFKKILKRKKINQPKFFSYREIIKQKELKKKFIAKPIVGSGSENIFILKSIQKLNKSHQNLFFEEYINSNQIFAIDGFCINREFFFIALSKKEKSKKNIFVDKKIIFNYQNNNLENDAIKLTKKICYNLNITNAPIHFEFILKDKKLYPIDFHLRGPGSGIYTDLMNKLIDVNTFEIQTNPTKVSKNDINSYSKNYFCYIYFVDDFSEKKKFKEKIKKIFNKYKIFQIRYKKLNKSLKNLNSTRSRLGVFYIEFNNYRNLKLVMNIINKK